MMTQAAQGALRRGTLRPSLGAGPKIRRVVDTDSYSDRDTYQKCPILHPLQLRQQNHPSHSIEMYKI